MVDYVTVSFATLGLLLILGVAFYGATLLRSFRKGALEKGWKYVAISGISLVIAQSSYLVSMVLPSGSLLANDRLFFNFLGILFLFLGLRAHLNVWISLQKPEQVPRSALYLDDSVARESR